MKKYVELEMSDESWEQLKKIANADNVRPHVIVEHLVMGRMVVVDGVGTVPELSSAKAERARIVEWLRETGFNPDKIADSRYSIESVKRDALADDIERGRHQ